MTALPDFGVGMVYWPALGALVDEVGDVIDVIEVEPQPFWFAPRSAGEPYRVDRRALAHLQALPHPKLVHGVGFPVGGTVIPERAHLEPFAECIAALDAVWASEHLSFNRVRTPDGDVDVGFLLPPVQSPEGAALAASNIEAVKAHVPVPFAFETGVSYLRPKEGELTDGRYFAAVAEAADCGILLDLHNLWANQRNGRQPVLELIRELPLERVWELHVAGGEELDGMWVDAHSGLAPAELLDLARQVVPRLPNLKAIVLEIMPEYPVERGISSNDLRHQLDELREIWDLRGIHPQGEPHRHATAPSTDAALPTPSQWEDSLAAAMRGVVADGSSVVDPHDPGVAVLRRLVGSVRAGKVAAALRLTTRLLLLELGEDGVQDLFERFWRAVATEPTAAAEARRFAAYLQDHLTSSVPHLSEVLAFELAAHEALTEGRPVILRLDRDVRPIIAALRQGTLPDAVPRGDYEVTVDPPAVADPERSLASRS